MGDDKIIDFTKFFQQQKDYDLEAKRQEFYTRLERADYATFKSAVVFLFKQLHVASDNFRDLEKWMEDLDWCVDKLVDHVAR